MAVMLKLTNYSKSSTCARRCCLVFPQKRCNNDPARNSQNNHKMAAFKNQYPIIVKCLNIGKMMYRPISNNVNYISIHSNGW